MTAERTIDRLAYDYEDTFGRATVARLLAQSVIRDAIDTRLRGLLGELLPHLALPTHSLSA
jgi:hypothetical protein